MDAVTWDQVKDLFADALELTPAERDAFLASHCSDPAVIAEILDLIKNFDEAPAFLEQPAVDLKRDTLGPGSQVGPYVIVRRLGGGGMGQVFLSNDDRLERKVALKRLIPSQIDPAIERSRILTEARAAARISHPNVAAVHDVLEHDGRIFIVMEFVDGESLAVCLRREWLPLDRVLTIGRQLAAALVAAHAQGVVHRDLKPANVQLTLGGSVKVLDFGIATTSTPVAKLTTRTGTVVRSTVQARGAAGTPEYMSPEQVRGRLVDARSDIFSLGLILFEMVTGRRPFADMGLMDRRATATNPVARADALDPRVPRDVADVIAKALAIDVNDRFQTAAELDRALGSIVRTKRTWKERAARIAAVAVITPLVLGLLGLLSSAAFNITLERPARFANESVGSYIVWGVRSNLVLIAVAVVLTSVVPAASFLWRLAGLVGTIGRLQRRLRRSVETLSAALALNDPLVLAQVLATAGIVALGVAWWQFQDLIMTWGSFVSRAPAARFLLLAPDSYHERSAYRQFIDLTLLAGALISFRIVWLREQQRTARADAAIGVSALLLVPILLLHQVPYRILYQNAFEKVDVAGERCYLLGVDRDEGLLHCPDAPPPRNRVMKLSDPAVHRLGVIESIFTPANGGVGAAFPRTP